MRQTIHSYPLSDAPGMVINLAAGISPGRYRYHHRDHEHDHHDGDVMVHHHSFNFKMLHGWSFWLLVIHMAGYSGSHVT